MQNVTLDKGELVKIVKDNKDKHRTLFEEAYDEYGKRVIENLEEALKAAREQKPQEVRLHFNLVKPEDHTEDYERVLYMLELEKNEEVILTQSEFAQLVQDDWGWRGQFNASYLSNTGKFAG